MPAKDDRPAQFFVKSETLTIFLKIFLQESRRHALDLLGGVRSLPSLIEGIDVHFGPVNLDVFPCTFDSQRLGKEHHERVSLLPRRAARAPNTDRMIGLGIGDDGWKDFGGHVLPGVLVAKKSRHINQNGIEEFAEFVGMDFEIIHVVGKAIHADQLHAFLDPPHQARAFVTREIEAAIAL